MAQQAQSKKSTPAKKQNSTTNTKLATSAGKQLKVEDVTPEERYLMIAKAAYSIAERRGFEGDMALDDWLQAEVEVNSLHVVRH